MSEHALPLDGHEAEPLRAEARRFRELAYRLGEYPHQIDPILEDVEAAFLDIAFFLHDASQILRQEAPTAVVMAVDPARAQGQANYAAATLKAAAGMLSQARSGLMRARSETMSLFWPEHDPAAAATVEEHSQFFVARSESVAPDPAEPASESASGAPVTGTDRSSL